MIMIIRLSSQPILNPSSKIFWVLWAFYFGFKSAGFGKVWQLLQIFLRLLSLFKELSWSSWWNGLLLFSFHLNVSKWFCCSPFSIWISDLILMRWFRKAFWPCHLKTCLACSDLFLKYSVAASPLQFGVSASLRCWEILTNNWFLACLDTVVFLYMYIAEMYLGQWAGSLH